MRGADLENLESRRAPSANVEAIYFAMPTEDSVRRIIRDFKVNQNATYSAAHLFFLAGKDLILLPPDLVLRRPVAANESAILCVLTFLIQLDQLAMDDKLFDHFRASTDPKYIKSLKELFMDFNGTNISLSCTKSFSRCYQAEPRLKFFVP